LHNAKNKHLNLSITQLKCTKEGIKSLQWSNILLPHNLPIWAHWTGLQPTRAR